MHREVFALTCDGQIAEFVPHRGNLLAKGASIYDVRTEGGRGVSPKEDVEREVA